MHSRLLGELVTTIALTKEALFRPEDMDDTVAPSDEVVRRSLAFILLCYSEIEAFLEKRTLDLAIRKIKQWEDTSKPSVVVLALVAFYADQWESLPASLAPDKGLKNPAEWTSRMDIRTRVNKAFTLYNRYVRKKNHGVSEKNIIEMLVPIGFDVSKLDASDVQEINNFSTKRGSAAHAGVAGALESVVSAREEVAFVDRVVGILTSWEEEFERLESS